MTRKLFCILLYSSFLQAASAQNTTLTGDIDPHAICLELPSDQAGGVPGVVSVICPESDQKKARELLQQSSVASQTKKNNDDDWVEVEVSTGPVILVQQDSLIEDAIRVVAMMQEALQDLMP